MLEGITNLFRKSPSGQTIPEQDTAYAANALLMSGTFSQYNPDDLMSRKGYKIYKKMMTDEQVKAVVRFHRDAVTGREWVFQNNPQLTEEENDRRREILTQAVKKMPGSFKTKLDMVMSALYNGFSMVEKTFKLIEVDGKSWVGIKNLTLKPFDSIYFDLDDYGNLERIRQQVAGYDIELDIKRFIHYACNPDIHEYYGQSELREAYRAWWSKDTTILLQNIFLERAAAGFVWASPNEKSNITAKSPEYAQLVQVLSTIRSTSSILLPKNIDLNVVHPSDTQAFDRAITSHDKAIAKSLLMPNLLGLSEQGPNGSRALGDTQLEAFLWILDAEAKQVEETINEQLFQELIDLNFADGLGPRWVLKDLSNKQIMEIITKWNELVNGNVVRKTSDDEAHIRSSLGFPEFDEENEIKTAPPMPPVEDESEDDDDQDEDESDDEEEGDEPEDETIMGKGRKQVSAQMAVDRAIKRVDFKVIDQRTTQAGDEYVADISQSLTASFAKAFDEMPEDYTPEDVDGLDFSKRDKTKVNNQLRNMLRSGWSIGVRHAKDEVGKAAGRTFSMDFARLDQNAAEYFQSRAFFLTGNLTNDMMKVAKNTLLNGMKDNRTRAQIRDDIYEAFAKAGFITEDDAESQMGRLLTAREGTTARLNTIIRTNTFEAVNEARYSFFTDPDLDDFVQALEYSAIMDSRTTGICQHMDGHVHAINSDVWEEGFRPPNHFNAIAEGVLIQTEKGLIPIQHVAVGDNVMTHMGRYQPVYAVMSKPCDTQTIRKITTSTGDVLYATDEHPIMTTSGWIRADEAAIGSKVFQRTEQWADVPAGAATVVSQAVLINAHNNKPLIDEGLVSYSIGSTSAGVSSAIQFQIDSAIDQKIEDIATKWNLGSIVNTETVKHTAQVLLMAGKVSPVSFGAHLRRLVSDFTRAHGVAIAHSFRMFLVEFFAFIRFALRPMVSAGLPFHRLGMEGSGITLTPDLNTMPLANVGERGFPNAVFPLNQPDRFSVGEVLAADQFSNSVNVSKVYHGEPRWCESAIISIEEINYSKRVYNLAVQDDETYMAGNVLVHNCRSLLVAVTAVDAWEESPYPEVFPQEGFS